MAYQPVKPTATCEFGHEYPVMAGECPVCDALDPTTPPAGPMPDAIQKQIDAAKLAQGPNAPE